VGKDGGISAPNAMSVAATRELQNSGCDEATRVELFDVFSVGNLLISCMAEAEQTTLQTGAAT